MNINKSRGAQIVAVMLLAVLVSTFVTWQYTIAGFQGAQESLPFYLGAPQPYSYVIDTNGTHYFAYNGTTGQIEFQSTNALTVLQTCHNALSTTYGGTIFIKSPFYADGQLIINRNNIAIDSGLGVGGSYLLTTAGVSIRQIKIDASVSNIESISIRGIAMRELHLYSYGHNIQDIFIEKCLIHRNSATYHGVVLEGDGTTLGFQNEIRFNDCVFSLTGGVSDGASWGMITATNIQDVTELTFTNPEFTGYGSNQTWFLSKGDADGVLCQLINPRFYHDSGQTGIKLFHSEDMTQANGTGWDVLWIGGHVEMHSPAIILQVDACASGEYQTLNFRVKDVSIWFSADLTVFNILNTDGATYWKGNPKPSIEFVHNNIRGTGTFSIGTFPTIYCETKINHNLGFVTENFVTSTNTTATTFVFNHGLAGTANYVFASFNTTAISGWSWTSTSTQVTITVTGTSLPAIMACYCEVKYVP